MFNTQKILERQLFRPAWYSVIVNPYFIVRRGLYLKIKEFAQTDFSTKNILDLGCGIKPYESLFKAASYTGIDIETDLELGGHKDSARSSDKYYNGQDVPYPDNHFEIVLCTEVLEHVADPDKLLSEIARVLKPEGQVYLTMPFVWYEHETPYDFNRFTRYEHKQRFEKANLKIQSIRETTGLFRTCGQLISAFIFENLFVKNKPLKMLVAVIICFPIQVLFIVLDFIFKNHWLSLSYVVIAKK